MPELVQGADRMLAIIVAAIRRRPAQAITLLLLAAVASGAAAAAPGYTVGSAQSMAVASVADARGNERLVSASRKLTGDSDLGTAFGDFTTTVRRELVLPGFPTAEDVRVPATVSGQPVALAYREKVCDHLVIDGACPTAPGEVVIRATLAGSARIKVGDTIRAAVAAEQQPAGGLALKVTGVFRPSDADEAYWGPLPAATAAVAAPVGTRLGGDVLFTPKATLTGLRKASGTGSVDYFISADAFRQTDPQLLAQAYEQAAARLAPSIAIESLLREHADRTWNDQQLIYVGVSVAAVQLLLLCWIALFLAIRLTADARRSDLGLLKMRGARRRDTWALTIGQSALPVLVGGAVGLFAGRYLAGLAVGEVAGAQLRQQTWYAALAAAGLAVVGAMVVAVLAERSSLSESVAALNRKVSRHRHSWAANAFDAVVVVLAVGGAYEARDRATADGRGLNLVAPVLVALAVGLVAARLLPRLAAMVAKPALRSGHLGIGLTAMNLARRPTLTPVFALLTLAVAVFFGTLLNWDVASRAKAERAAFETGAARVLTVQADSVRTLMSQVRAVDPEGRYAMAAVENTDVGVLAVDAPRLGVSQWDAAYGLPPWDQVAAALHPAALAPYLVGNAALQLDVSWSQPVSAVTVVVELEDSRGGAPVTATFGPLVAGRHTYGGTAAGCGETAPCRVASIALSSPPAKNGPAVGTAATLHELRIAPAGPTIIDQAAFGDRTRWRASIASNVQIPDLVAGSTGLAIAVGADTLTPGGALHAPVYPFDAPSPLPTFVAGDTALTGGQGDPRIQPFPGSDLVAVHVAGSAHGIPRLGDRGVLVDLEYALRVADVAGAGSMEVWLSADAPAGLVPALQQRGIRVMGEDAIADRLNTLQQQGPAVSLRFALLVALIGVALAVGAFAVVTTAERGPRGAEFVALRRQGMRAGVVRAASYGGYLIFVTLAAGLGIVTAVSWRSLSDGHLPIFADNWAGLPLPTAGSSTVGLATLALLALVAAAATAAAAGLVAAVVRGTSAR